MVGVHGNHHEVKLAVVQADFDVKRNFKLKWMRAEKRPCFAESVVAFIDHAVDFFTQHARRSEDLEAEFISIPFEIESGGGHLSLGATGPQNGSRITPFENGNHRTEPKLWQRGDGRFTGSHV